MYFKGLALTAAKPPSDPDMTASFANAAAALLDRLADRLETALADVAEVDYEAGILQIEIDGAGTWVVNRHAPTAQIWMSSPVSGAHHFAHDPAGGPWADTRGGADLETLLRDELAVAAGVALAPS